MRHRLGLATRTQISVCKLPFPSAGPAVSLFRAKTVQQRPLLPREVETRLPDRGATHEARTDHPSRPPAMPPSTPDVNRAQIQPQRPPDASRSNSGPSISGRTGQLPCPMTLSTSGSPPPQGRRPNAGEHRKPRERCRMEGTRDETHCRAQPHADP